MSSLLAGPAQAGSSSLVAPVAVPSMGTFSVATASTSAGRLRSPSPPPALGSVGLEEFSRAHRLSSFKAELDSSFSHLSEMAAVSSLPCIVFDSV